ncbi:MAG: hypothetical protein M1835_001929 [Candelina submexicana]|nr:MAG: hypothetical protein M1835_001929 [Candelina submexicana]
MAVSSFKINIPESELKLLQRKLELTRLPTNLTNSQWGEDNGVTIAKINELFDFWKTKYDWRAEESRLNTLPQFQTPVEVANFGTLDIHFLHSKSSSTKDVLPLLFIHGWPGNFTEIEKALPLLNEAGFDVVAPSLPGYGFSSYTEKPGFKKEQHAEVMHKVMTKLGYSSYVVQGGDWGSWITRCIAQLYPSHVKAIHLNMLEMPEPKFDQQPTYTPSEKAHLERRTWFHEKQSAYLHLQGTKPRTLGFALHDSPIGMLAWMCDKLFTWSDAYPWTPTELITFTLLHYFPGPTTSMQMYFENDSESLLFGESASKYVEQPVGVSAFAKELVIVPRSWAETRNNIRFWKEHESGGHFAAHERPEELAGDTIEFFRGVWKA